jgi:hypothetical protein
MSPELQLHVESLLGGGEAQFRHPSDFGGREFFVGELGEHVTTPQRVGLGQEVDGACRVATRGRRPSLGNELLETVHVDRLWRNLERVATAAHGHETRRTKRAAKLRHEPLKAVADRRRRVLSPQRIDELISGYRSTGVKSQDGKKRPQLRSRDHDICPVVIENLELAEKPDVHESRVPVFVGTRSSTSPSIV